MSGTGRMSGLPIQVIEGLIDGMAEVQPERVARGLRQAMVALELAGEVPRDEWVDLRDRLSAVVVHTETCPNCRTPALYVTARDAINDHLSAPPPTVKDLPSWL